MWGAHARVMKNSPTRSVLTIFSNISGSTCSVRINRSSAQPALLTRMSMRPNESIAAVATRSQSS